MNKLTPQNKRQENMVQILLAKMQGIEVEYLSHGSWYYSPAEYFDLSFTYRIKPHELPITKEMWAMIGEEWKWAAKDKDGEVCFYKEKPFKTNRYWYAASEHYALNVLTLNTDGIDWRKSLTRRPEGV